MQFRIAVIAGLAVSGLFVGSVRVTPAVGDAPVGQPRVTIGHAGLWTRASLGTFCMTPPGATGGFCADTFAPPRVRAQLPVRRGGRVVLKPSVEARSVVARLMRVNGSKFSFVGRKLAVERQAPRRWVVRLRNDLAGANVLDVFITWNNERDGSGDADFATGIRRYCTT